MNRLRPALLRHVDDAVHRQITLRRRRRTDPIRVVCILDVKRLSVGIRIDGDAFDVQLAARAADPNRDLAAIGDQNSFKHQKRGNRREATGKSEREGNQVRSLVASTVTYSPLPALLPVASRLLPSCQSGMFPCFFGGLWSCLFLSISSERIRIGRVSSG